MDNQFNYEDNAQSIQTHLNIMQNIIQRMASNSSTMKASCITLVSAILVIVADKGKPDYAFIALIPTTLFMFLDTYYLSLEKGFRNSYNQFVEKNNKKQLCIDDLYGVKPFGNKKDLFFKSIKSFSIWFFYLSLVIMIALTRYIVLK